MEKVTQPQTRQAHNHPLSAHAFESEAEQDVPAVEPPPFQLQASTTPPPPPSDDTPGDVGDHPLGNGQALQRQAVLPQLLATAPQPQVQATAAPIQREVALPQFMGENVQLPAQDTSHHFANIVLSAVARILDSGLSAENRAQIMDRSGPFHPEYYRSALAGAEDEAFFLALWDFWKARWEVRTRAGRRAYLALGRSRIIAFLQPRMAWRLFPGQDNRARRDQFINLRNTEIEQRIPAIRNGALTPVAAPPAPAPAAEAAESASSGGGGATASRPRRPSVTRVQSRSGGSSGTLTREQVVHPDAEDRTGEVTPQELQAARDEIRITRTAADTLLWINRDILCVMGEGRVEHFPQLMGDHDALLYRRSTVNIDLEAARDNQTTLQRQITELEGQTPTRRGAQRRRDRRLAAKRALLEEANTQVPQLEAELQALDAQIATAAAAERTAALAHFRDARTRLLAQAGEIEAMSPEDVSPDYQRRLQRMLISWIDSHPGRYNATDWRVFLWKIDRAITILSQTPSEGGLDPLLARYPRERITGTLTYTRGGRVGLSPVTPRTLMDHPEGFANNGVSYQDGLPEAAVDGALQDAARARGEGGHPAQETVLQQDHRETAVTILYTFQELEGTPTSMNTWDSADLTAASGIAARGRLERMMHEFKEQHPREFRRLFQRFGIDVYRRGGWHLSVRVPEQTEIGGQTLEAGDTIYGEQAIQYIINDPVLLIQFRRAGQSGTYQSVTLDGALRSMQSGLAAECRNGLTWAQVIAACPDATLRGEATFAVTNAIHGPGNVTGPNGRVARTADLTTEAGARSACEGAISWMTRGRRRRRMRKFRTVRDRRAAAAAAESAETDTEQESATDSES